MTVEGWAIVAAIIGALAVGAVCMLGLWTLVSVNKEDDQPEQFRPNRKLSRAERLAQRGTLRRVK